MVAVGAGRVLAEELVHGAGREHVDSHRSQAVRWIVGHRRGLPWLLLKPDHLVVRIDLHDAEAGRFAQRHGNAADGEVRAALQVQTEHVAVIHLVDVVPGENQDVTRFLFLDAVNVLVDGVRRPLVPMLVDTLLRGEHFDVIAQVPAEKAPAGRDVAIQASRLVLRQDQHPAKTAVDAVGEREVNDPIKPAKGDRRFRPIASQGVQPCPLAASQNQGENVSHPIHHPFLKRRRKHSPSPENVQATEGTEDTEKTGPCKSKKTDCILKFSGPCSPWAL